jgi:hypothetical protein
MSQGAKGELGIEQGMRNMKLVGIAGAAGDLITLATIWLILRDAFPVEGLYTVTIVMGLAAVFLIWTTQVLLPRQWEKEARGFP